MYENPGTHHESRHTKNIRFNLIQKNIALNLVDVNVDNVNVNIMILPEIKMKKVLKTIIAKITPHTAMFTDL